MKLPSIKISIIVLLASVIVGCNGRGGKSVGSFTGDYSYDAELNKTAILDSMGVTRDSIKKLERYDRMRINILFDMLADTKADFQVSTDSLTGKTKIDKTRDQYAFKVDKVVGDSLLLVGSDSYLLDMDSFYIFRFVSGNGNSKENKRFLLTKNQSK